MTGATNSQCEQASLRLEFSSPRVREQNHFGPCSEEQICLLLIQGAQGTIVKMLCHLATIAVPLR